MTSVIGRWLERNADVLGVCGLVALVALLIAYWWCPLERDSILNSALMAGGGVTLLVAFWRSAIAQRNSVQERYRVGSELLGSKGSGHLSRVIGAAVLDQLVKDDPVVFEGKRDESFSGSPDTPCSFRSGRRSS